MEGRYHLWPNKVWPRRFTKFGQMLFSRLGGVWPSWRSGWETQNFALSFSPATISFLSSLP